MKLYKRRAAKRARFLRDRLSCDHLTNIADVGANPASVPAYQRLLDIGAARLWGFEPGLAAFDRLRDMQGEGVTYFNSAVGAPGPATFYEHPIGSISSTFPISPGSAAYLGKSNWLRKSIPERELTLVALDDIEDLPPIDVLKMDLQGGECDVLRHGAEKLANAVAVITEVRFYRMYSGEPLWAELDQLLHAQGFVLHRILFAKSVTLPSSLQPILRKRASASQLLDGDAVYIRNLEDPDNITSEQFKHLALAADAIFQSFDLVAMCLDVLTARGAVRNGTTKEYGALLPDAVIAAN